MSLGEKGRRLPCNKYSRNHRSSAAKTRDGSKMKAAETSDGRNSVMKPSFVAKSRKPKNAPNVRVRITFVATAPSRTPPGKDSKRGVVSRWTIAALTLTNFLTIYVLVSHAPAGVAPTSPLLHYYPFITLLPFQFVVPSLRIATNLLLLIC